MYAIANSMFFNNKTTSIEDIKKNMNNVTKEQVIELANKTYVDTIYLLGGKK